MGRIVYLGAMRIDGSRFREPLTSRQDVGRTLAAGPVGELREAIRLALGRSSRGEVPTSFSDADLQPFRAYATDPACAGGTEPCD